MAASHHRRTAEIIAHGLSQAFQKRGLPRSALLSDNGAAMTAAEITQERRHRHPSHSVLLATLPIRLRHTPATCWVRPVAGIKLGIGRCLYITGDAEQRAESVERVQAPVKAKREFVEVGL
jgi:hypothetical protein